MRAVKTTINIRDDLLREARNLARARGITLHVLVEEGLRMVLARRAGRGSAPVAGGVRGESVQPLVIRGDGPPPDLTWDRLRGVLYGDEEPVSNLTPSSAPSPRG
jgi:hypothetical protein